nr:hypothetical protein CFP56_00611 [Quercus suber]
MRSRSDDEAQQQEQVVMMGAWVGGGGRKRSARVVAAREKLRETFLLQARPTTLRAWRVRLRAVGNRHRRLPLMSPSPSSLEDSPLFPVTNLVILIPVLRLLLTAVLLALLVHSNKDMSAACNRPRRVRSRGLLDGLASKPSNRIIETIAREWPERLAQQRPATDTGSKDVALDETTPWPVMAKTRGHFCSPDCDVTADGSSRWFIQMNVCVHDRFHQFRLWSCLTCYSKRYLIVELGCASSARALSVPMVTFSPHRPIPSLIALLLPSLLLR